MKHRTIVLVTHHVDLVLPIITWVVKLHDGRIQTQGTVAQLRESGVLSMARAGEEAYTPDDPTSNAGEDTEAKPSNDPVNKLVEQEEKSTYVRFSYEEKNTNIEMFGQRDGKGPSIQNLPISIVILAI